MDRGSAGTIVTSALEQLGADLKGPVEASHEHEDIHEVRRRPGLILAAARAKGERECRFRVFLGSWQVAGHAKVREVVLRCHLWTGEPVRAGNRGRAFE